MYRAYGTQHSVSRSQLRNEFRSWEQGRPMAFRFMFGGQEASPWATSNRALQFPVRSCHLRNDPDVRIRNRKKGPVDGLLDYVRRTRGIASATSNRALQFPVRSCHLRNDPDVRIRSWEQGRPMAFRFMFGGQDASPWATSNRELQFPVRSCHLRNDPDVWIRNRKKELIDGLLDYIQTARDIALGNRQPRTSAPC